VRDIVTGRFFDPALACLYLFLTLFAKNGDFHGGTAPPTPKVGGK
jgi:hypothetical protein